MYLLRFLKNIYGKTIYLQIVFTMLLSFGAATAQFLATQHLGDIIDAVERGYEETMRQFLIIAVCTMLYILGTAMFTLLSGKITAEFSRCARIKIEMKLCTAQYRKIEQIEDGYVLTTITRDVDSIRNWIGLLLKSGFLPVCLGLVPVCLFQWCNWKFALPALCMIPLNALPSIFFARKLSPFHDHEKRAYTNVLTHFTESLRFVMLVKAFQLEQRFRDKHKEELNNYGKIRKKRIMFEKLTEEYGRSYGHISRILLLLLSAYFIDRGEMTLGRLTSVILCAEFIGEGLKILGNIPLLLPAAKIGGIRIQKILDLPDELVSGNKIPTEQPSVKTPVYEVRDLAFSYKDTPVLQNINFRIYQGEKVAVVGVSGCGKTTLFKLLNGLYTPGEKQIYFKGMDIASLSPAYLRNHITVTTQEAFLFQATLKDNIKAAKSDAGDTEIIAACHNARLDSFIQTLAHGYDTEINTTIQSVSNGQMQRINLARAFLRNTDIFLLDEPASALDYDTAGAVWDYLFLDCADKTLLVILHDLEEIYRFQKILVLDHGQAAAFGTHKALMQNCGLYRNLFEEKMKNSRTVANQYSKRL